MLVGGGSFLAGCANPMVQTVTTKRSVVVVVAADSCVRACEAVRGPNEELAACEALGANRLGPPLSERVERSQRGFAALCGFE